MNEQFRLYIIFAPVLFSSVDYYVTCTSAPWSAIVLSLAELVGVGTLFQFITLASALPFKLSFCRNFNNTP